MELAWGASWGGGVQFLLFWEGRLPPWRNHDSPRAVPLSAVGAAQEMTPTKNLGLAPHQIHNCFLGPHHDPAGAVQCG